jgi:2-phospho-L-lactate guanylyltransferase
LLRASDVDHLLEQVAGCEGKAPFALLTPSHDRMGTNALLFSPPDIIKLGFGYDSFSYHLGQVRAAGLAPMIVENENIALDIDEPKDLERFLATAREGRSYETALKTGAIRALQRTSRSGSL